MTNLIEQQEKRDGYARRSARQLARSRPRFIAELYVYENRLCIKVGENWFVLNANGHFDRLGPNIVANLEAELPPPETELTP